MTREQAINSMISHGFTVEQVGEIIKAVTPQFSSELDKNSKKLEKDFGELDCISRADAIKAMQDKAKKLTNEDTINGLCGAVAILFDLPSVTPQLSVPEVTALAEWTTKLTKTSEDAYNKGYEDGMKAQEPQKFKWCTDCKEYDQEKHCCHRWSKVIRDTVEEMKQEQEPILDKVRAEILEEHENAYAREDDDTAYGLSIALDILDEYKAETEE